MGDDPCSAGWGDDGTGFSSLDFGDGFDTTGYAALAAGLLNYSARSSSIYTAHNASIASKPQRGYCGLSGTGAYLGASGAVGAVQDAGDHTAGIGAAGQGQLTAVHLGNGQNAVFSTTGGFYQAGNYQSSSLANNGTVLGSAAGVGGGIVFTNAQTISDFSGPARAFNLNIGLLDISFSSNSSGIRTLNIGASFGAGASFSNYNTNTRFKGLSGC